jgi:excinuclease UvrABC nuclease subunit
MKNDGCQLYRHFGGDGTLLYVGVSISAFRRLAQHRGNAHWFGAIKRIEMQQFATREEALAAEREAIEREQPLFNIQFSARQKIAIATARAQRIAEAKPVMKKLQHDRQQIEAAFWQWREQRRASR